MKIKSIICALFFLCAVSSTHAVKRPHYYYNDFVRAGKSLMIQSTCDAIIEDNNVELNIKFHQAVGYVNVVVTNGAGQILHSGFLNATIGETYTFSNPEGFDLDQEYYLSITNSKQYLLAVFSVE